MTSAGDITRDRPVLVTGGAGYIGSHAVLALRDAGWPVVVLDNLSTGFRSAIPEAVPLVTGDIGDEALLADLFARESPIAVMHFAGSIIVRDSVADPLRYYHNNTAKSRTLIAAAVNGGVPHFIFSSTAAVYGNGDGTRITEEAPCRPVSPYGWSKLMTEQMLADTATAHPFDYAALRYFNVAGADPQARTGQATAGATHLIKVALEAALGERYDMAIFGTDYATSDGTGVRDYVHVSDLVAAHVLALEKLIAEPGRSLVMNCGYGRGSSVREVLDAVERVSGVTLDRRIAPRRAGDPAMLVCDPARIRSELGWKPRFDDLETIIADALRWERRMEEMRAGVPIG